MSIYRAVEEGMEKLVSWSILFGLCWMYVMILVFCNEAECRIVSAIIGKCTTLKYSSVLEHHACT